MRKKKLTRRSFLIGSLASSAIIATTISPLFGKNDGGSDQPTNAANQENSSAKLKTADQVKITILVDNYTDMFLANMDKVKRNRISPPNGLLGEPGFSCLVEVSSGFEKHRILFDGGISGTCLLHNMQKLNIDPEDIDTVVLSHGHYDHFGGIKAFYKETGKSVPLVVHPDAFLERRYKVNTFFKTDMTSINERELVDFGAKISKRGEASTIASDLILVSGKIRRKTSFEKGFPKMEAKINNNWVVDPFNDDQGICINLKGQGLVVIGGCSHAGIINTINHFRDITEEKKVHAVLGGFHLSGPAFEPIIAPTIQEMKTIDPDYVAPMHCTGWKAINRFAQEMPDKFLLNCVGSTYEFS